MSPHFGEGRNKLIDFLGFPLIKGMTDLDLIGVYFSHFPQLSPTCALACR
jgi:hypothetical protein